MSQSVDLSDSLPMSYVGFASPNKRSFRGPGGVVGGLNSGHWAEICARELASVVSQRGPLWYPRVSRGLRIASYQYFS